MKPLYKTEIVIWSEYDPTNVMLEDLASDAQHLRGAGCSERTTVRIQDGESNPRA